MENVLNVTNNYLKMMLMDTIVRYKTMKGFQVRMYSNKEEAHMNKSYTYKFFKTFDEAHQYAEKEIISMPNLCHNIFECDIVVCSCGRIFSPDEYDGCLMCEELRMEAQYDKEYYREEE